MTHPQQAAMNEAAKKIGSLLDEVFNGLSTLVPLVGVIAASGCTVRSDLDVLRAPVEELILTAGGLVDGAGVAAAPGLLDNTEKWLQWYRRGRSGEVEFTSHSFNPISVSYYDYTAMSWFQVPVATGQPSLAGPYIDIGGTDLKIVTASVPVVHTVELCSVIAADLSLDFLESVFLRALGRRHGQILLVTQSGKVVASNTARHTVGTLLDVERRDDAYIALAIDIPTSCNLANPWRVLALG